MINLIVKWDLQGSHNWPDAPDEYELLKSKHGHIFHFEVHIPVEQVDRQLEFLDIQRRLILEMGKVYGVPAQFSNASCETIAVRLCYVIKRMYDIEPTLVAVYEDQFVGAEYIP